jgi:hypothetical protein
LYMQFKLHSLEEILVPSLQWPVVP